MRQSYEKKQHEIAKAKNLPLITMGYDGRYLKKPQGQLFSYGPSDEKTLKELQALFLKHAKRIKP
jgi:hypothetical protein